MFRVSTWTLLGIIAAALFAWIMQGGSLTGPRVAGWTDFGTWGLSGEAAGLALGSTAGTALKKAGAAGKPGKPKNMEVAEAPKAREAAPWDVEGAKGVDIDLNIKMPWGSDDKKKAAGSGKGIAHGSPWPVADKPVKWDNVRAAAPEMPDVKAVIISKAIKWVIADKPVRWSNVRTAAAEPEPAVSAKAIDWPIAKKPVQWTNGRSAPEPEPAVTAKAIDWPIAKKPVQWTNVRSAPEPEPAVAAKAIDWPIAEKPVQWTNVRSAPEPERNVTAKAIDWPIATEVPNWNVAAPAPEETARREQMTVEQIACEDELRRIYASGVIQFKTASAAIDRSSSTTLDALAKAAKQCAKVRIRVEGHTDSRGSDSSNQSLSERRAQAIVSYLAGAGVDPGVMTSFGYGETRPVADNDNEANMAKNRRIEFTVY